jgi:DNA (cytosine-5)-methyltransferase 1
MREFYTVDLFCGAGGASTGLELALSRLKMRHKGLAINHWSVAVDTMKRNHPDIDTKQMGIEEAVPADLVPGGVVDLLWASPSCTHHSRAKGGKPRSNQLRAQPELVLTWLDQLFVRRIIIENVPEFVDWGPLTKDGKPIERLKGSCFRSWVASIEARNYAVEWRVVNCADYGDATSRRRFFLKAVRKGCGRIRWPEPTHAENPQPDLFGHELKKWRGVRECLDLSDTGKSIFNREKPLAENTLRRIMVGLRKYNGLDFQMDMLGAGENDETRVLPTTAPLRTQHTANRTAIVRPFIVRMNRHCTAESVDAPISVITTSGAHHMLCHPLILDHFKNGEAKPPDAPMPAQTTHDRFSMITPYLITEQANNAPRGIDKPLRAQTTVRKDYLCTPLVLGQQGGAAARPIDEPCPTIATGGAVRMITPLVLGRDACAKCRPADKPMPTLTTGGAMRIITPIVMDMSHPGDTDDERRVIGGDEPINTITTRNNSAAVMRPVLEDGRVIDIRIRMLKPSELAAAHSFPKDYVLTGNRGEQVKQIGNSVPVMTAAAMCEADFRGVMSIHDKYLIP